jgi:hypothetical protein
MLIILVSLTNSFSISFLLGSWNNSFSISFLEIYSLFPSPSNAITPHSLLSGSRTKGQAQISLANLFIDNNISGVLINQPQPQSAKLDPQNLA